MTTPYDKQIGGVKTAEANRGLSAIEDSQLQRLQHKRESRQGREPEVTATKNVIIREFCDGLKEHWYRETMGRSTGALSDISNILE